MIVLLKFVMKKGKAMQGNPEVIAYMNELLAGELSARDQYFIPSRMFAEWCYNKLFDRIDHEMADETAHASDFIRRILMLGGTPASAPSAVNIGTDVPSILKNDLATELEVRDNLKKGIALCEKHFDYVSRDLLVGQLKDTEEDHAHWLEQQLYLIEAMGLQNYLQSQN
jgi:bacterioferritin